MEGDLAVYDLQNGAKRVFKVDRVFGADTDQLAVYEDTQPLIRSVLDGRCGRQCGCEGAVGVGSLACGRMHYPTYFLLHMHEVECGMWHTQHQQVLMGGEVPQRLEYAVQGTMCAYLRTAKLAAARRTPCRGR